ncbi:hypothetical protein [Neisseria dentiae]|uniref:hypothetical protein n=1 Tax=Neisseria dentiae TaxID=194197 RepID=UPI0035A1C69C
MTNYKICPICESDCIYYYTIPQNKQSVKICWECDSMWLNQEKVGIENSLDYATYLTQQEISPTWGSELKNIYEFPVFLDDESLNN